MVPARMDRTVAVVRSLLIIAGLLLGSGARADFADWWLTPNQQGRLLFDRGEYARAAQRFSDPLWKGLSLYASQDFASAAAYFAQVDSAYANFYLGNAMAQQDKLREALDAYETALTLQPEFEEARFNRQWVQGLYDLSQKEYQDVGGTGGQLAADDFVIDDRAAKSDQTMTTEEVTAQGLSDDQIEAMWMRRVQTTPADFLAHKFAYQVRQAGAE